MADEDPKLDSTRYYLRPGCTEPELRPEFADEESAAAEESAPVVEKAASKKKAASKPASKKK